MRFHGTLFFIYSPSLYIRTAKCPTACGTSTPLSKEPNIRTGNISDLRTASVCFIQEELNNIPCILNGGTHVIGACPVTTECIVAMSSCENNNCSTPIVPRVACKNNTAKYHSRDTTLFPSRLSTKTWGAGPKRGNLEQKTVRLALSASRQTTKSLIAAMKKSPCATNACEEYLLR